MPGVGAARGPPPPGGLRWRGGGAFRLAVCALLQTACVGGLQGIAADARERERVRAVRAQAAWLAAGGDSLEERGGSGGGAKDPLSLEENILGLPFRRDTCGVVVVRTSFVLILPPSPLHPFRSCCSAELYICKAEALVTSKV